MRTDQALFPSTQGTNQWARFSAMPKLCDPFDWGADRIEGDAAAEQVGVVLHHVGLGACCRGRGGGATPLLNTSHDGFPLLTPSPASLLTQRTLNGKKMETENACEQSLLQALQPQPPGPLAKRSNDADGAHPSDPPGHRSASHDITEQLSTKQKKNGHSVFGELSVNSKSVRDRHCAWNTGAKTKAKVTRGGWQGMGGCSIKRCSWVSSGKMDTGLRGLIRPGMPGGFPWGFLYLCAHMFCNPFLCNRLHNPKTNKSFALRANPLCCSTVCNCS